MRSDLEEVSKVVGQVTPSAVNSHVDASYAGFHV